MRVLLTWGLILDAATGDRTSDRWIATKNPAAFVTPRENPLLGPSLLRSARTGSAGAAALVTFDGASPATRRPPMPRNQEPSSGRPVAASKVEMTEIAFPNDANALGNVMGGRVMQWIDICAAVAAGRHARTPVVTAS